MCGWIGIGRAVLGGGVERAMLGFAGVGVEAVLADGGTWMKQTSGGSEDISQYTYVQIMMREERRESKRAYRVLVAEDETEAVNLVFVDGVVIKDLDVHLPFSEVVCFDDLYPRRELLFGLGRKSVVKPGIRDNWSRCSGPLSVIRLRSNAYLL